MKLLEALRLVHRYRPVGDVDAVLRLIHEGLAETTNTGIRGADGRSVVSSYGLELTSRGEAAMELLAEQAREFEQGNPHE